MPESYWLANRQPADAEFQRLELLGSLYGRTVKEQLRTLGFGAGATVLEIGPGSGHFVRWLIDEGAHVTVVDLDDRYFNTFTHENVTAQIGDARTAELGSGYDFVIAQMVLHHIPERLDLLQRLATCLRPGGWLVANEPDTSFMWTRRGSTAPVDTLGKILVHLADVGFDYEWGGHMPAAFDAVGLAHVDSSLWTPTMAPGTAGLQFFRLTWPSLRSIATARRWIAETELDAVDAALTCSDLVCSSMPAVLCCGQAALI